MALPPQTRGRLLTAALAGAWRAEPPASSLSEDEWRRVAPLLVGSGAASLGWWKLRGTKLKESAPALRLREVYRFQTLQSALHEREIEALFRLLNAEGVEAVLIKGWAAARLYPEAGLRPFGDIDVCVRPAQRAQAARVLGRPEAKDFWVDLHADFKDAHGQDFGELYTRAETLTLGAAEVRVLSAEDHLRLLCLHLLRHGAWRPLWLCDVAAAVEGRPHGFDWPRLLGADERRARWVSCAVGLAHQLLGARVEDTPLAGESKRLPRWLVPEVLRKWETPFAARQSPARYAAPMRKYLRRPSGVLRDLLNRWPSPIEATVHTGGPFNELPRLPFQLGECAVRAGRFLSRLPRNARGRE
jgi:hypothetical protein